MVRVLSRPVGTMHEGSLTGMTITSYMACTIVVLISEHIFTKSTYSKSKPLALWWPNRDHTVSALGLSAAGTGEASWLPENSYKENCLYGDLGKLQMTTALYTFTTREET